MFEKALRLHLKFRAPQGLVTTEDLWDLSLTALDKIAIALSKEVKNSGEESFIAKKTKENEEATLKFNIVKHIIDTKLKEQEDRENAAAKRARNKEILSIIEEKKLESMKGKSIEELEAMLQ